MRHDIGALINQNDFDFEKGKEKKKQGREGRSEESEMRRGSELRGGMRDGENDKVESGRRCRRRRRRVFSSVSVEEKETELNLSVRRRWTVGEVLRWAKEAVTHRLAESREATAAPHSIFITPPSSSAARQTLRDCGVITLFPRCQS